MKIQGHLCVSIVTQFHVNSIRKLDKCQIIERTYLGQICPPDDEATVIENPTKVWKQNKPQK